MEPTPRARTEIRLLFPTVAFAARCGILLAFAFFAFAYGGSLGTDPAMRSAFATKFPTLAALGHGEVSLLTRQVRLDWGASPWPIGIFPLVPLLGRVALALGRSVEGWLISLSMLAGLAACWVVYRFCARRSNEAAAGASLSLLLAFPFAFHLSDGGTLPFVVLSTALAVSLAAGGRLLLASLAVTLGALAHPAALAGIAPLLAHGPLGRRDRGGSRPVEVDWALALAPLVVFGQWLVYLARQGVSLRGLVPPFGWGSGPAIAAVAPFAVLVVAGIVLLFRAQDRSLALMTLLQAALLLLFGGFAGARALAACWGAFLPLGSLAARRPDTVLAPAVAIMAIFQGLFFYLHAHHFPAI